MTAVKPDSPADLGDAEWQHYLAAARRYDRALEEYEGDPADDADEVDPDAVREDILEDLATRSVRDEDEVARLLDAAIAEVVE